MRSIASSEILFFCFWFASGNHYRSPCREFLPMAQYTACGCRQYVQQNVVVKHYT